MSKEEVSEYLCATQNLKMMKCWDPKSGSNFTYMVPLGPNIRIGQSKATTPTNFHECLNFGSKKQFIFCLS